MAQIEIEGVVVPLLLPYMRGYPNFAQIPIYLDRLRANGVNTMFFNSSVGRGLALSDGDALRCVRMGVWDKHTTVLANVSDFSTERSKMKAKIYFGQGVHAVVSTLPLYYTPLSTSAAVQHFTALADIGPLVLYDLPGRVGKQLELSVVEEMAAHPNCVGIKYSGDDSLHLAQLLNIRAAQTDGHFSVLAANQVLARQGCKRGTFERRIDGVVVSTANVFPAIWSEYWEKCRNYFGTERLKHVPDDELLALERLLDGTNVQKESELIAWSLHLLGYGDGSLPEPYERLSSAEKAIADEIVSYLALLQD